MEIDFNKSQHVYFMGIGGISMSGLAGILLSRGFKVSGSDRAPSELTDMLEKEGATVNIGQRASNIKEDIDLVVYTAAIHQDNPEFIRCKELNLPMMSRAEFLGQLMKNYNSSIAISGTHGKTTTSSMAGEILMASSLDPTLSIGGILPSINGNIRIGNSEYFLTEACEYTNSFLSFFPKYEIILNIEEDHLDFFKDLNEIRTSFKRFGELLPEDGVLIINSDIKDINEITKDIKGKVITFGKDDKSDYFFSDLHTSKEGYSVFTFNTPSKKKVEVTLRVRGIHNVLNAVAALALADILNLDLTLSSKALFAFEGAKRRFEYKGCLKGVNIFDDYAHHPTEIKATLEAASTYPHKNMWVVFQPHTYSRTKAFMDEFAEALSLADNIVLTDIYAARENDNLGISSEDLMKKVIEKGKKCYHFRSFSDIENFLLQNCIPEDMLITMGAGDVLKIGESLLGT
ncbi:MAG: UDP-N-acetylmuramate--L-alanine ligase [Lachnospiraceae bacterium]|nr:UDP-N-acetylmuramate--L-alanine ligase [Lachnospiraceae bacterium]